MKIQCMRIRIRGLGKLKTETMIKIFHYLFWPGGCMYPVFHGTWNRVCVTPVTLDAFTILGAFLHSLMEPEAGSSGGSRQGRGRA